MGRPVEFNASLQAFISAVTWEQPINFPRISRRLLQLGCKAALEDHTPHRSVPLQDVLARGDAAVVIL
jgi:hypothetical protein